MKIRTKKVLRVSKSQLNMLNFIVTRFLCFLIFLQSELMPPTVLSWFLLKLKWDIQKMDFIFSSLIHVNCCISSWSHNHTSTEEYQSQCMERIVQWKIPSLTSMNPLFIEILQIVIEFVLFIHTIWNKRKTLKSRNKLS